MSDSSKKMRPSPGTGKAKASKGDIREKIAAVVKDYDLSSDDVWSDLDELSTHTLLEGVEVDPEGVLVGDDGKFKGVFNVYVTLQYGKDVDEGFATSDSFLGKFEGHLEGREPKVDKISVDTSPFYK